MTAVEAWLPGAWFTVVLIFCYLTVWAAVGIRDLFSWQATVALILFGCGVFASNAWQFTPGPELVDGERSTDPEDWRIYFNEANEAVHQAKMWIRNLAIGFALVLAFRFPNRAPMLTYLILGTWLLAETGESIERPVCKANDPALWHEHEWLARNERRPTCGQAFGTFGSLIFPALSASPLPFILLNAWRKSGFGIRPYAWGALGIGIVGIIVVGAYA